MAVNFFELLGFSSDEMADTMPEKIVQAFHDKGKDGVRVLMYEEMAKRMSAPLHIYSCNEDNMPLDRAVVYGKEQPGEPVRLIRENTDLYRRWGDVPSSPDRNSPEAEAAPRGGGSRKRTGGGGGGGGGSKTTGPDAWEKRFQDLADFVARNGFRPRRTAPEDSERHLHYWMGQQQRKLGHNELPKDQAEKLESLLQTTKGKKAEGGRKSGGSRKRDSAGVSQQHSEGGAGGLGDDADDNGGNDVDGDD